jgi:hypothetical protein
MHNAAWIFASFDGSGTSASIDAKLPLSSILLTMKFPQKHQQLPKQQQHQPPLRPMPQLHQGVYQLTNEAECTHVNEAYLLSSVALSTLMQ